MACRECESCGRRFGTGVKNTDKCVFCDGVLSYNSGPNPTVTAEEYKNQLYIKGDVVPEPLPEEMLKAWEHDWQTLEEEAERRAPWWGVADLFADWSSVRPV
jgi:hypothetical protein